MVVQRGGLMVEHIQLPPVIGNNFFWLYYVSYTTSVFQEEKCDDENNKEQNNSSVQIGKQNLIKKINKGENLKPPEIVEELINFQLEALFFMARHEKVRNKKILQSASRSSKAEVI